MIHKRSLQIIALVVLLITFASCAPAPDEAASTKTIVDMAGRDVDIPTDITRIYAADPGSMILVYTVAPQMLIGWSYKFNETEANYILPEYIDLPVLGMGAQVNYEAVIAENPQVAIMVGKPDDATKEKADNMESQIGIPVVVVDLELFSAPNAYLLMGVVIGDEERGEALSTYAQNVLDSIVQIPENERLSVYYANGIDSLNTSAQNTAASQLFDIIYAQNVCQMESETGDRLQITIEHLLTWNPDFIFVNGEPKEDVSGRSAAQNIYDNPDYANIKAVTDGNVISIPKAPFAWVDRPRSQNRLVGIQWLGSIMYPEYYDFDKEDIKEFYKLFYHLDLTDEQVTELLNQ